MPTKIMTRLLAGTAISALLTGAAMGAEARPYDIAAQDAATALQTYAIQSGRQVLFPYEAAKGKKAPEIRGDYSDEQVLALLAASAGLQVTADDGKTVTLRPQFAQGASGGGGAEVEALIVTAQKREENIQDVPIAISAFSQKSLDEQKIEGGFDLVKAIPNVTFSKNNFTSYNFSIRGVGTKAVSATTDPGVAVAFNNTTIIQNRLFEQEYFDLERVEVLRGPQGTLYGRNATSGVINVISAKPDLNDFDGWIKGEVGNYHSKRLSAMINIPLVEDRFAIRLAGALTDRQGYDYNTVTENAVNGRDLWSARLTIGFEPTEQFRGNLVWERFEEDDNRSRTGKQLCHHDVGPATINGVSVEGTATFFPEKYRKLRRALFSQGCLPGSLYDDGAFDTPNGLAIPFIGGVAALGGIFGIGYPPGDIISQAIIRPIDPYAVESNDPAACSPDPAPCLVPGRQSTNMREIASVRDPIYRASADLIELNLEYDLTDTLTFFSQTAYVEDKTYSFQDFNRFNSQPVFADTSQLSPVDAGDWSALAPGGIYCDPQIGCSDTIAGFDIAKAEGTQFNQEFRLQSDFDGPVNFSIGANYTKFETLIDYYVMFNVLSATAAAPPFNGPGLLGFNTFSPYVPGECFNSAFVGVFPPVPVPTDHPDSFCVHIDPNPVESIDGTGHNYFRSKNPYDLESAAGFGEVYWNAREDLKLTVGLRYTNDKKTFIPVPSQTLLAKSGFAGGTVSSGYPEKPALKQEWGEWTGRLGVDWKPELGFTDDTLLYAFYSHGYKGGGANPPKPGFATREEIRQIFIDQDINGDGEFWFDLYEMFGPGIWPVLQLTGNEYGDTFEPEFVDAFEVGAKNTLLGGAMTLNITGFYYDYQDYQVSQIRDRTAVNENFDAKTWGLEFESIFAPSRDLQIIANLGYLDTEIADGETSIDIMNRTQGDPNYVIAKPWFQLPSNCVIPANYASAWLEQFGNFGGYPFLCGGVGGAVLLNFASPPQDPNFPGAPLDFDNYPQLNGGAGLSADLGGNELPNAPHWTANIGAQYGMDILDGTWRATLRGDVYWQSQSWARVYNLDPYDKLHGWWNANITVGVENPDNGLRIELYAKNILDDTPITDAFLNSDDTALTTNVFVLDPRLIGLSIRKEF